MNLERQIVLQKKEEATAPSVKSDSSGSSGGASSSSAAPQVSNIIVDNNFLMTYRGISITTKPAETWDDVDEILQSSSKASVSGGVKADSASSVSGGGQTGTVSSDNTSSVSGGGSSALKTKVLDSYTVKSDNIGSNCMGTAPLAPKTGYGLEHYELKQSFQKEITMALQDIVKQISEQCKQNGVPFDMEFINEQIDNYLHYDEYPSVRTAYAAGIITDNGANYVVDREALYKTIAKTFNGRIQDTVVQHISGLGPYSNISLMTDTEYREAVCESFSVSADVIIRNDARANEVDKYNVAYITIPEMNFACYTGGVENLYKTIIKNFSNLVIEQARANCEKNNIPFDSDLLRNKLGAFLALYTPTLPELFTTKTTGMVTSKMFDLSDWGMGYYTGGAAAKEITVDYNSAYKMLADKWNNLMCNPKEVSNLAIKKPQIQPLEYKYDPKSKLSKDEQMTRVTLRNISIAYKNIVEKYGDKEIDFKGTKCTLSTLAYVFFKASNSTAEIKAFTKEMLKYGNNISQQLGVKADNSGSVSSGSSSSGVVKSDNAGSVSSSKSASPVPAKALAAQTPEISAPQALTRSMDFNGGYDVDWNENDGSYWTDWGVVITPDGGYIEDWDPMDDPDWDTGLGQEDNWQMLEQDSMMDEWIEAVSSQSDNIGIFTDLGTGLGMIENLKSVGYVASFVSFADVGIDMYKNGINFNNGFAAVNTTAGCLSLWGAAASLVAKGYKDGIEWTAEFFSGLESQMQKLFSSPDWMGKFMMGF